MGRCIYGEAIDLAALGALAIRRGSHVEPTDSGQWLCDLSPVNGPAAGAVRHTRRSLGDGGAVARGTL